MVAAGIRFRSRSAPSRGFTYLIVLFAIVLMGTGLAVAGQVWHSANLPSPKLGTSPE